MPRVYNKKKVEYWEKFRKEPQKRRHEKIVQHLINTTLLIGEKEYKSAQHATWDLEAMIDVQVKDEDDE